MIWAAVKGHMDVVHMLLEWPGRAPAVQAADCQIGEALFWAAANGHADVVRLLEEAVADAVVAAQSQDGSTTC